MISNLSTSPRNVCFSLKSGDAVHVLGESSENNSVQNWYGVVKNNVDASTCDTFEIEYLSPKPPQNVVHEFEGIVYDCPVESIVQHVPVDETKGAQYAWIELGFRMLNGSQMVLDDEEGDVPVGDAEFEIYSSDEDEDTCREEMKDFLVDDSKTPKFTFAEGEFARDTHACVRAFEQWRPEQNSALGMCKEQISRMEAKAALEDDEKHFRDGKSSLRYKSPPV